MQCLFCGTSAHASVVTCPKCGRALPPPAGENETAGLSRPPSTASIDEAATIDGLAAVTGPARGGATAIQPGQVINHRYRVIKLLGQGGMGAVYQAWDDELNVAVALKVILPQLHDSTTLEYISHRFKQELLLARQITHKNVVRIHDIGEFDGIKFISMPYISGDDLANILKQGALPVPRALGLARQIAAGLFAAHEAGVVHRDLKPGNVMVQEGEFALLMDFGIARSVRSATGPGTIAGTVVGTIEYMAPEQARAEMVDGRADVYAFGLILQEMLIGPRRLTGESAMRDLVGRMTSAPPPVRGVDSTIPEALEAIVTKCLQPAPEQRFQSSAELIAALNRLDADGRPLPEARTRPDTWKLALVALLLVAAGVAVTRLFFGPAPPPPERAPVSVLIADFDNRAGDPVFDGALENVLSIAMEGAPFVTAFSQANARAINTASRPGTRLDEEGAKLVSVREGINVVLAGSIVRDGPRYRIAVRVVDPIPNKLVTEAAETADTKADVLGAVNTIAARLREALGDTTTESTRLAASETFTTSSLEAVQEYSRAQELSYSAKYAEASDAYRRALQHDPNMGRAYAGLAQAASRLGRTDEAETLFKEALARLDRMTEREKFRTLGLYYNSISPNPEKAIENFSQLVQKYPADASALNNLAVAHFRALHFTDALEYGKRLVSVYPRVVQWRYNYALYGMYAGDFEVAKEHGEEALRQNQATPKASLAVAMAAVAAGDMTRAKQVWEQAAGLSVQGASLSATALGDLAIYEGRPADAIAILDPAIVKDRDAKNIAGAAVKLVALAEARRMSGDSRDALQFAEEALKIRRADNTIVPAARLMLATGRRAEALALAEDLGERLNPRSRAWGKLIEGEAALQEGRAVEAVDTLREGVRLADLWLIRYALGVAYEQAGAHAEALSELEACEKRRGEATAVFLDDEPTWRYSAPLIYWLARAREGVGVKAQAAEGYKRFLSLRTGLPTDPLVLDATKRVAP